MSSSGERPWVALNSAVTALLPQDLRDAITLIELPADGNHGAVDLSAVRFLAPGPRNRSVLSQLPELTSLEVLQTSSAGTDWVEPHLPPQATLCNARGARDAPVVEWIVGALFGASSHLLERVRVHRWEVLELDDLARWTVLVVGMGSIGRALETALKPFGCEVVGVASYARDDLHGIDELPELLPEADAVVLLAPLTDATHHLINAAALAAMKDGAVLINAARGAVVDTDALVKVLQTNRIRAILDVTDPEPLPEDHPLWDAPGLLAITPHIAGASPAGHLAAHQLAITQLRRWLAGEPLENVVVRPSP